MNKGQGTEEHGPNPSGLVLDWATSQDRQGGGGGRNIGGKGWQRKEGTLGWNNSWGLQGPGPWLRKAKGGATRQETVVTGLCKELIVASRRGRKAQTIGGGRQVGAPSRWTDAPRPGELGDEKRVQQEIEVVSTGGRRGRDRSQVRG